MSKRIIILLPNDFNQRDSGNYCEFLPRAEAGKEGVAQLGRRSCSLQGEQLKHQSTQRIDGAERTETHGGGSAADLSKHMATVVSSERWDSVPTSESI